MSALIHQYTHSLKRNPVIPIPSAPKPETEGHTVVLTGSTGTLGTHLLHTLLHTPSVAHIYCLNRSSDAAARQESSFAAAGLAPFSRTKATFLTTDLSHPTLGLPPTTYTALATTTTTIIHNAWPVNFNTPLAAFAPSLAGTRHLADLAAAAAAHVTLISSIGSVMNYPAVRPGGVGVVPEEFDADNSLPIRGQGYAESKHVAGCILHRAARVAGVRATVLRVGQVGGPMRGGGVWNRHEWLPSLIASSKVLGRIPRALGRHNDVVTWLPVDVAAEAVRDLALAGGKAGEEAECFNVVNPRAVEWAELVAAVQKFYSAREGRTIEQVSLGEWLDELNRVDATDDADKVERFPALKLLDFFQGLNADGGVEYTFSTDRAVEKSPAMAGSRPIDGGLMEKWLEGWAF